MPRGIPGSGPKGRKRKLAMAANKSPKATAITPQAAFKQLSQRAQTIAQMQQDLTRDVMTFLFGIT